MAGDLVPGSAGEFLFYQTDDGRTRVQVHLEDETVWLTQKQRAEFFQKDVRTINEHMRHLFDEGELRQNSVVRDFRITAGDGKQYATQHYRVTLHAPYGGPALPPRLTLKKSLRAIERAVVDTAGTPVARLQNDCRVG